MYGMDRDIVKKDDASNSRINNLVTYLSTRKESQTDHVATVMEMSRRLAAADHEIQSLRQEISSSVKQRDFEMMNQAGYENPLPVLKLPAGTRKVSIEL